MLQCGADFPALSASTHDNESDCNEVMKILRDVSAHQGNATPHEGVGAEVRISLMEGEYCPNPDGTMESVASATFSTLFGAPPLV